VNFPYTIRKLRHRPGSLYVDFRLEGKRHCLALETLDKKVALLRAAELYAGFAGGTRSGRVTVEQYLLEYRAWADANKKPRTRKSEENALHPWLAFNHVKFLADVSHKQVDAFVTHLATKPALRGSVNGTTKETGRTLKPATVHSYISNLRTVFSMAVRWKYLQENPFHGVPLPTFEKPRNRTFTLDEIKRILLSTAEHSPECIDIFILYFLTGMRASEALRLQWDNVKWDEGFIELVGTKGRKVRDVPLGSIVRAMLRRRLGTKPFDTLIRRNTKRRMVRKFDLSFVSKEFKRMTILAGVPNAMLKQTRGTYATALLEVAGVSLLTAQSIVGHADIKTMKDYYHNPLGEDTLQKAAIIDAQFRELLPESLKRLG